MDIIASISDDIWGPKEVTVLLTSLARLGWNWGPSCASMGLWDGIDIATETNHVLFPACVGTNLCYNWRRFQVLTCFNTWHLVSFPFGQTMSSAIL